MAAIGHAHRILDWHENAYRPEEVPPEWMWPFEDLVAEWFDQVNEARRAGQPFEPDDEEGQMMVNDLSPRRR